MADGSGQEVELKFEMPAENVTKLLRAGWLRAMVSGRPHTRRLRAVYFDTPAFALRAASCSLRIRREGRRTVQCLKSRPDGSRGSIGRNEFEVQVPDRTLRTDLIPDEVLPVSRAVLEQAVPVFEVETQRTIRLVQWDEETQFELACDKAQVSTESACEHFAEVEVELKQGGAQALFEFAHRVTRTVPCRLAALYKADRGFRLIAPPASPWVKGRTVALRRKMTAEEGFIQVFLDGLRCARQNEQLVLETGHPEAVHQLRLGLRRLRSLLQVYKANLPVQHYRRFNRELRWIGERGGAVRDWDVFMEETLGALRDAYGENHQGLAALGERAAAERSHAQASLTRALRSARYTRCLLRLLQWVQQRQWREQPVSEESAALFGQLREFATEKLSKRSATMKKKGRRFARLDAEQCHQFRIAVKKLRYAVDFLGCLYKGGAGKEYAKRLRQLQHALGTLNDAANTETLVQRLLDKGGRATDPDLVFAAGLVVGWKRREACVARKEAAKRWRQLNEVGDFW